MTDDLEILAGWTHHWRIGTAELARYATFRWGAFRGGRGVDGCWTPWGALFALWRMDREARRP